MLNVESKVRQPDQIEASLKNPRGDDQTITFSVKSFCWFQYSIVTILIILGAVYYTYADSHGDGALHGILELFDPGNETSITTSFSVLNLLISSVLIFGIYRHAKNDGESMTYHWLILSIIFFGLSIDEGAAIHERAGARFFEFTEIALPVIQTHRWLLAGVLFTAIVGVFFIPFLLKLDAQTRWRFLLAGAVFVSGALVVEFIGALMINEGGYTREDLLYRFRRVLEEGCELVGIAIFNCTLLDLIQRKGVTLRLASKR